MEKDINTANKKILVVDDSPEAIDVLCNALPKHYKRQFALSGEKALRLLAVSEELPDLILLDVMMPEMNGYEVCRLLKKDYRLKNIPVIFLSSLLDSKDKVMAFQNGGVDYIEKPFEIDEVQARVETHMRLHDLQLELELHNRHLNQLVENKVKEISESQMETIYALVKLSEARDDETGTHTERVAAFCSLLVNKLREIPNYQDYINDSYVENIYKASPLHDIGKVGIPDHILLKPGKLSPDEFEIMKTHTTIGAKTLMEVKNKYPKNLFIELGNKIALSHHEKWDGSGYPLGLKGNEIPLEGKIMALADVYDALRSKRVYKDAYPHEKCCTTINEGSGSHFDPEIVNVFLKYESEFDSIFNSYNSVE
jgi:putative two-component system response regulator